MAAAANSDALDDASSPSHSPFLYDVLGSATAGIFSRIVTHPLDTAKARLQAPVTHAGGHPPFRGPLDALIRTYQREGLHALYGGFGAVIVGGTPGTVLYLTGYAFFRDSLSALVSQWNGKDPATLSGKPSLSHGQEFAVHFSSGMLAEAVTCIIYVPVDVVKERMQVQQKITSNNPLDQRISQNQYKGSWDALRRIIQTEGLRGIYKGYGATLGSFGPFSALYFVFYERCKFWAREYNNRQRQGIGTAGNDDAKIVDDGELPLLHLIACSASAGALASWLTSPLDMAKLRLQVQRGQAAVATPGQSTTRRSVQYRNALHCLSVAYREGGFTGLFRGAGARVLHFAPATAVTMTCYEKCRSFYAHALG